MQFKNLLIPVVAAGAVTTALLGANTLLGQSDKAVPAAAAANAVSSATLGDQAQALLGRCVKDEATAESDRRAVGGPKTEIHGQWTVEGVLAVPSADTGVDRPAVTGIFVVAHGTAGSRITCIGEQEADGTTHLAGYTIPAPAFVDATNIPAEASLAFAGPWRGNDVALGLYSANVSDTAVTIAGRTVKANMSGGFFSAVAPAADGADAQKAQSLPIRVEATDAAGRPVTTSNLVGAPALGSQSCWHTADGKALTLPAVAASVVAEARSTAAPPDPCGRAFTVAAK